MIEQNKNHTGKEKQKGLFSLFSGRELKSLFKKYLFLIFIIEIIIFMVSWLYQIGAVGYDRFGVVDKSFPWKNYFLTAFLVPVGITFLFGIFIIAFESLFFDKKTGSDKGLKKERETKLRKFMNFVFHVPFLTFLLAVGLCAVLFYDFELIAQAVSNAGKGFADVLKFMILGIIGGLTILGVLRLIFQYKLRKKEMEHDYRLKIASRTGVAWVDSENVVEKDGKIIFSAHTKKEKKGKNGDEEIYLPGINDNEDN
ncbi:MAG: hypothetical protein ACQEQS_00585 [Thermodesulfobacteriota bacterium]